METTAVSELRANLPRFLKKVEMGEVISITSHGNEVAWLVPPTRTQEAAKKALREIRQTAIIGDVLSPIEDEWAAIK
ncbi:MAG TPA: type II toxin-antitoxin system Phd/YefM family antitoxin [Chloroflexi bacterium]|nr:type II toxin-antitoxin system Phd/YefM family antitoxin [Chloroflexota bacterium]